jgi:hypothetical protein
MILLNCTHCRAQLEIDDAFAGGVCRCMYCGTIQTVPSHLKRPGAAKTVKALYKQTPRAEGDGNGNGANGAPPTELDQLADVVASSGSSSGLAGSGLASGRLRAATIGPPPVVPWHARNRTVLVAAAGAACSLVLLTVVLVAFSGDRPTTSAGPIIATGAPPAGAAAPVEPARPNFCGVPIDERVVVYVLDRGSATGEMFGYLKEAAYRSVESLGSDHKFQIVFWDNGTTEEAYPRAGPTFATPANLDAARKALDNVNAHGQSDPASALARAMAAKPGAVVLATGKGYELDDAFVRAVDEARKSTGTKVYTFALGGGDPGTALRTVAKRSGGEFRAVDAGALRDYAQ